MDVSASGYERSRRGGVEMDFIERRPSTRTWVEREPGRWRAEKRFKVLEEAEVMWVGDDEEEDDDEDEDEDDERRIRGVR
mmetsp:Transcript_28811/g.57602  ORF Transcript_28811/g.57602 Transcript_28811/m.57602 type:complete len:80 (+) Transcript_28811:133-372(+)